MGELAKQVNTWNCAGPTLWRGTLTRWWACLFSAPPSWSERRYSKHPHTNMFTPVWHPIKRYVTTCACPLQGILAGCNSMCAGYLFQPDKQYDVTYDTGDKAIQCGRHVDIFKFWLMWKAKVRWRKALAYKLWRLWNVCCNMLLVPAGHCRVWAAHWQVSGPLSVPVQQDQEQGGIWDGVWWSGEQLFGFIRVLLTAATSL